MDAIAAIVLAARRAQTAGRAAATGTAAIAPESGIGWPAGGGRAAPRAAVGGDGGGGGRGPARRGHRAALCASGLAAGRDAPSASCTPPPVTTPSPPSGRSHAEHGRLPRWREWELPGRDPFEPQAEGGRRHVAPGALTRLDSRLS